jgi:peptidoglycan/LPS O-acetylase OafA/YrhL
MARKRRKPRPRRPAAAGSTATKTPAPPKASARQAKSPRGPIDDERPPAPWGTFPLVEIVVLVALVMLAVGFFGGGSRGPALLGTGLALGSLAGLELSIREHFAGYRSHTLLLSGAVGVAVLALLFYVFPDALEPWLRFAIAAAVAGAVGYVLARAFRARAGRTIKLR